MYRLVEKAGRSRASERYFHRGQTLETGSPLNGDGCHANIMGAANPLGTVSIRMVGQSGRRRPPQYCGCVAVWSLPDKVGEAFCVSGVAP